MAVTPTVTVLRWAQPWHYDPRDRVTRPELAPVFIPPPPTGWQKWVDELEHHATDQAGSATP